jgi:hypothetical protein
MSDLKVKEGTLAREDSIEATAFLQTNPDSLNQMETLSSESNSARIHDEKLRAIEEKFLKRELHLQNVLDKARDVNGKLIEANATFTRDIGSVHIHNLQLIEQNAAVLAQNASLMDSLEYIAYSHSKVTTNLE